MEAGWEGVRYTEGVTKLSVPYLSAELMSDVGVQRGQIEGWEWKGYVHHL